MNFKHTKTVFSKDQLLERMNLAENLCNSLKYNSFIE